MKSQGRDRQDFRSRSCPVSACKDAVVHSCTAPQLPEKGCHTLQPCPRSCSSSSSSSCLFLQELRLLLPSLSRPYTALPSFSLSFSPPHLQSIDPDLIGENVQLLHLIARHIHAAMQACRREECETERVRQSMAGRESMRGGASKEAEGHTRVTEETVRPGQAPSPISACSSHCRILIPLSLLPIALPSPPLTVEAMQAHTPHCSSDGLACNLQQKRSTGRRGNRMTAQPSGPCVCPCPPPSTLSFAALRTSPCTPSPAAFPPCSSSPGWHSE